MTGDKYFDRFSPSSQFLQKLTALMTRVANECPVCSSTVKELRQIGPHVYAKPCGCHLWQGTVPETWSAPR